MKKFKKIKRAYYSFLILAGLYLISLFSEFIANDKPLLIKFNGKFYFPVFKFYPECEFIPNGNKTRADYKKINASEIFKNNCSNYMIFPFIPYGPNEIESSEQGLSGEIRLTLKKINLVFGSVRVDKTMQIIKSDDAAPDAFGITESELLTKNLSGLLDKTTTVNLTGLIQIRYSGQPDKSASLTGFTSEGKPVNIKLSSFSGGEVPDAGIKIRVSEGSGDNYSAAKAVLNSDLKILGIDPEFLKFLSVKNNLKHANFNGLIESSGIDNKTDLKNFLIRKISANPVETDKIKITVKQNSKLDEFELSAFKEKMKFPYKPSSAHIFGIDDTGRDIFARLLYGFRISMSFALILSFSAMTVGIIIGGIQGYSGGLTDIAVQRFTEIWSAIPFLYVIILLGDLFGKGLILLLVCYAIFNWIGISYYMRGEFLRLKKFQFVEAAKSLGLSKYKIIFRHILPNALTPVVTFFPFSLMSAIASLSALDYLGYSLPAPTPSWGELLGQAQSHRDAWWLIAYPSAALFITMLLTVFIGEGVREAFDSRKKIKYE
ncbi:MAG TPA: ABC transporter permease subunit [bacterium]|nr:ABC transporter permease subunit [bacterium]